MLFSIGDNAYDALFEKERLIKQKKLSEPNFIPTITIRAMFKRSKAVITIADNGMGIRPESLSKVGELFYSTKATYKESMGLGIWMARRYLQMNGGL